MASKKVKKKAVMQPPERGAVIASSAVNEDFDRQMSVTARTTEGTPIQEASFQIVQLGLREPFIPSDSDEPFEVSDGEPFGVLKL